MTSQPVPHDLFETAVGISALGSQIAALEAEREAFADSYLALMGALVGVEGRQLDLLNAYDGFRIAYGAGWQKRAKAAGVGDYQSVKFAVVGICNDGDGRWRGTYPVERDAMRPRKGVWVVYQLLLGEELVYIGSTGDFVTRLKAHTRDKSFDGWRAARCDTEQECRELEAALIDRYRPPLNRMIPTPRLVLR